MRPYHWTIIVSLTAAAAILLLCIFAGVSYWWLLFLFLFYIHALALGAVFIRWNFYIKAHHSGKVSRQITLTFDDGPVPHTNQILGILKEEKVPAAFFCIGKNVTAHPEIAKRIVAEGHIIGNHSFHHSFHFDWQSAYKMMTEIRETNAALAEITGKKVNLFRPPYGVTNPNLSRAVRACGMTVIGWRLRSFDTTAKSEQKLLDRLLRQLKGGDVILLHDTMPVTANVLTSFIQEARKRGFIFAPLDEVLSVVPYA